MKNSLSEPAPPAGQRAAVKNFVYRDCTAASAELELDLADLDEGGDAATPDPNLFLSQEQAQALLAAARTEAQAEAREALWEQARTLAEQELRAALEQRLEQERTALAQALHAFDRQREEYFHQLEREMVQMALAIARKVLHREAQIDPLLLAGTVRVALDPLAAGTPVELVVPPSSLARWEEMLRRERPLANPPRVRSDAALEPSGCRLETDTGVTDLSWEFQLREIEQGFLDLLQRRAVLWANEVAEHDRA